MAISEEVFSYFEKKYDEKYCKELLDHCSEGRSIESFAAKINNIPEVLAYWSNKYPDFEACLRVAYWKSFAFWENLVVEDTNHIREFKTIDPALYKLVMKHRFNWRDVSDDLMLELGRMSDKELELKARKILQAREGRKTIEIENEHID